MAVAKVMTDYPERLVARKLDLICPTASPFLATAGPREGKYMEMLFSEETYIAVGSIVPLEICFLDMVPRKARSLSVEG
jgi:hypothetical protein